MKKKKHKVGFTAGTFDLTHAGHYMMFEECKEQCSYLIVALQTDPTKDRPKKNKPVQSWDERYIQVLSCRYVDMVIKYETESDLLRWLHHIRPDVRFIGADWKGKEYTGKELPVKVIFNSRDHNYSSSNLRKRIVIAEKKCRKK